MFYKTSSAKITAFDDGSRRTAGKTRSLGSFEYEPRDGFLYVSVRACSADVPNLNDDMLPHEELKTAYRTFEGCPVFVNHKANDPDRARGYIIGAEYHDEDPSDRWIEILMEMDEVTFPKLCGYIRSGEIDTVSMGCFVPGTMIKMGDGTTKKIEDVKEGDVVLTKEGAKRAVTCTMVHEHDGVIYEISSYAQGNSMKLTEEHPVWIRRPQRKAGDSVRARVEKNNGQKDHVCTCGREFETHRGLSAHIRESRRNDPDGFHDYMPAFEGWVFAKDVEIGDYVLDPSFDGEKECDRNFARLLGYYLAEGNFCYDSKRKDEGPSSVEWTFNESEVDYHQEVAELIRACGYKPVGPYFKNGAATIRCNSPEFARKFLEHGGKYSWGKKICDDAMSWDVESQREMLEAYFNGDAHWSESSLGRRFEYATVSKDLAEQIYCLCLRCGIRCSVPKMRIPKDSSKRNFWTAQGCFDGIREQDRSVAYADEFGLWRRVTKVRMLEYHGNVYNFEVEESHSYVAENCAVHNCNVSSTECSICGNVAENASEFCGHVLSKGNSFDGKRAYEICHGIEFVEESWVYDPADPTATVQALEKEASIEREFGPENFYDSTESNWTEVEGRPSGQPDYTSESGSEYWYYDDGVVRGSDHWGYGIGSCHWYLDYGSVRGDEERYGFSNWDAFSNTHNFDYVVDRKIERMLEGYDPGQGTLENHVFEDLRWNRTDLNMDVYEEAKRMIGVTASRRKQSAVGFVEMNPQDGTWYAACGTEEDPEKYWVTTKETKEDAIDALKNPQDWFEGEYERADEVYEVEDYFFGDEELEGDRVAESEDSFAGSPRVPEEPDMSDNDEVCPMCGSMAYDGEQCSVCGYQDYSEGFGNIEIDHDEEEEYEEDGWEDAFNEDKKKLAEFFL